MSVQLFFGLLGQNTFFSYLCGKIGVFSFLIIRIKLLLLNKNNLDKTRNYRRIRSEWRVYR